MGVPPRAEGGCVWVSVRSSGGHRTLSQASPSPDVALTLQKRAAAGPSATLWLCQSCFSTGAGAAGQPQASSAKALVSGTRPPFIGQMLAGASCM